METKKLRRSRKSKVIAGVCGGIAEYMGVVDPVIIRLFWALTFLAGTLGFWIYLIAWIIIPKEKKETV